MPFPLEIVSTDGKKFQGEAERLTLRSIAGDVAIMAKHTNYCTGVGMSTAKVLMPDGSVRKAACVGGMLSVIDNHCRLMPNTWEWCDEIDVPRAQAAKERAEKALADPNLTKAEKHKQQNRLYRAMIRLQTAQEKDN